MRDEPHWIRSANYCRVEFNGYGFYFSRGRIRGGFSLGAASPNSVVDKPGHLPAGYIPPHVAPPSALISRSRRFEHDLSITPVPPPTVKCTNPKSNPERQSSQAGEVRTQLR